MGKFGAGMLSLQDSGADSLQSRSRKSKFEFRLITSTKRGFEQYEVLLMREQRKPVGMPGLFFHRLRSLLRRPCS